MTAIKTIQSSTLQVKVDAGIGANGKAKSKVYGIANFNPEVTADVALSTGNDIADLLANPKQGIYTVEKNLISQGE